MPAPASSRNRILARLSRADFQLIEPHLEPIDLPLRKVLAVRGKPVSTIYFVESGFASVVANGGQPIELGLIGREGLTGISVVMGVQDKTPHQIFMQMAGSGQRMAASELRSAMAASTTLHFALLRFAHSFLTQATETALANGRSKVEERLARWLLLARDRGDSDELHLTHEFLAIMLGVRRSGVTVALQELVRKGMISHKRAIITITDRAALEDYTTGIYTPPRDLD